MKGVSGSNFDSWMAVVTVLSVGIVAVFTREIAEDKATRATDMAREEGYPLLFTTEPEA